MRLDLITALPDLVRSPLEHSIVGRARESGVVEIHVHDLRAHGLGKYRQIDDAPYGGMGGMVLTPEPLAACLDAVLADGPEADEIVFLTPDGDTLDQPMANRLSLLGRIVMIAGHYKGIDQRIRDTYVTCEISVGDYVLSGGELPALTLIDALVRLLPGALGDSQSALSDSFQDGLLDAPTYTRPASWRGLHVPDVLRSGNHGAILDWREAQRLEKTRQRRPDLLASPRLGTEAERAKAEGPEASPD
ncbi:MAG: tRNA (guanosine(37)-N1)-methyltransferase TrmD [Bacteroidota bacterium]